MLLVLIVIRIRIVLKNASKRLKELCLKYNCEVKNPLGSYPYNMKKINDKTKKSRPKGYDFPQ